MSGRRGNVEAPPVWWGYCCRVGLSSVALRGLRGRWFCILKYEQSCLPLFQLLNCAQQPWSDRINTAALQNAVLYAREYNKNCIEADQIAELRHTPSAGTCYYLFPAEDA